MPRIEKTVFISYRRTNYWTALAVYQDLTTCGFDVFIDYQNLRSGDFEKVIIENIKWRTHFLVILSPSALERCSNPNDLMRREIESALDEGRNIVPLIMEGFDFGSPDVIRVLTGKLTSLNQKNGLRIIPDFFPEAMERLRKEYLNVDVSSIILQPLSIETKELTDAQISSANDAEPVQPIQLTAEEWFERGYVFQRDKKFDEAIRCYNEVIELEPDVSITYNNLGVLFGDLERYVEAEEAYRQAIAKDPNAAAAYYNLGLLLKKLERYAEAEEAYRQAIAKDPNDAAAYYNLGILLKKLERYAEAEEAYRQAIAKDPNYAAAYNNLALLLRVTNQERAALPVLEKLIVIDPENFNPYLGIASISKALGESVPSEYVEKVSQSIPEDDFYNRACLESVCENLGLALQYLQRAAQKEKFNPAWAWEDPDLQWIRDDPRFAEIVGPKPEK